MLVNFGQKLYEYKIPSTQGKNKTARYMAIINKNEPSISDNNNVATNRVLVHTYNYWSLSCLLQSKFSKLRQALQL